MSPPLLQIRGLRCSYGARVAVADLDLTLRRGEILGLLGPNGAGKSTVFHVLSGLLRPEAGTLQLLGQPFDPLRPEARRRLGVVFQDPSLDDQLTVRENLRLLSALHGLTGAEARARVDEALELCGLADRANEPVRRLSGGMKRRVELSRVLLHQPDLLLMDEPSRGLDAASLRRYWDTLQSFQRQRGLSILLTTHQAEEAEYCQRIALLSEGRLLRCDTPEALRAEVGGDVLRLAAREARALIEPLLSRFPEMALIHAEDEQLTLSAPRAHELIPRLVESLPGGRLRSVSLQQPSLLDVFIKLAGRGLADMDRDRRAQEAA